MQLNNSIWLHEGIKKPNMSESKLLAQNQESQGSSSHGGRTSTIVVTFKALNDLSHRQG